MAIFHNIILERTGDSRWYIKHTGVSISFEQVTALINALDLEILG